MLRWEIKNLWIPLDTIIESNSKDELTALSFVPSWKEGFVKAWAEAEVLADDGWELVSTVPEQKGYVASWVPEPNDSNFVDHARLGQSYGYGCSYTNGYLLVFKRPKP